MRVYHGGFALLGALLLLGSSGCALRRWMAPDAGPYHGPSAAAPFSPGTAKPGWQGPAPGPHAGLAGPGAPQGVQQASYPGAANEQFSILTQRLASLDDDRRAQGARIQHLENQLRDKDKALVQAALEIQEATAQMTKTREELQRWKLEMESLRGKLRGVERDNKTTLEAIIHTLEQFLDRERVARAQTPPLAPLGPTPLPSPLPMPK